MIKRKTFSLFSILFVLCTVFFWKTSGAHAVMPFDMEKAIASGDHKGLAEYYRSQATEQKKIAEMHDKMKTEYRNTHVHYKGFENVMAGHCGNLSFKAREMAEQYEKLAEQEEKLANKK